MRRHHDAQDVVRGGPGPDDSQPQVVVAQGWGIAFSFAPGADAVGGAVSPEQPVDIDLPGIGRIAADPCLLFAVASWTSYRNLKAWADHPFARYTARAGRRTSVRIDRIKRVFSIR
jgi:hypothetical protein